MGQAAKRKLGIVRGSPREQLDRKRLEALVLARLSVASRRRPTRQAVSGALQSLLAARLSPSEWRETFEATLDALCSAGLIEAQGLVPTASGLARLAEAFALDSAPRARSWREFKTLYLPRLFCGEARANAGVDVRLALLSERLKVPLRPKSSTAALVDAWLVQELGLSGAPTPARVRAALVARALGVPARATPDAVLRQGLTLLAGSARATAAAVTDAMTVRWVFGSIPPASPAGGPSGVARVRPVGVASAQVSSARVPSAYGASGGDRLARFVARVESVSAGPDARTYGPDKVFIVSVWERLALDPEFGLLGVDGFKAQLVEAHRRGLLRLSRADLVAAMAPADVAASETRHQNATYHFIVRGGTA